MVVIAATENSDKTLKKAAGIRVCAYAVKMLCIALQQVELQRSYTFHLQCVAYVADQQEAPNKSVDSLYILLRSTYIDPTHPLPHHSHQQPGDELGNSIYHEAPP
eukprot:COSAG01_NODE_380_length_17862_cov_20.427212_12_plen_105_part_00